VRRSDRNDLRSDIVRVIDAWEMDQELPLPSCSVGFLRGAAVFGLADRLLAMLQKREEAGGERDG
jgi:hypothetical protein